MLFRSQLLSPLPKAYSKGLDPIVANEPAQPAMQQPVAVQNQAATAPAPAPVPVRPAAAATAPAHHSQAAHFAPSLAGPGLSLRHSVKATPRTESATALRDKAFAAADVERLWREYIDTHPGERFLVATMRKATPQSADGIRFAIETEEGVMANSVLQHLDVLHKWMRDRLENDHFEIDVKVTVSPDSPSVWTDRQVFEHMLKKSEDLTALVSRLKLTLD